MVSKIAEKIERGDFPTPEMIGLYGGGILPFNCQWLARLSAAIASDRRVTEIFVRSLDIEIPRSGIPTSTTTEPKKQEVENPEYKNFWETIVKRLEEVNDVDLIRDIAFALQDDRVQAIIQTGDPASEETEIVIPQKGAYLSVETRRDIGASSVR